MDGRALPVNPEPRWNGYSIGRWEGDTLVIETIGFDDRAWLDQYGNVYSTDMRFEERWRRVGRDTLEAVYRIDDPASYTRPWVSTTKVWKRQAQELREEFCAPMDELQFNELVRDPAAGVVHSPCPITALTSSCRRSCRLRTWRPRSRPPASRRASDGCASSPWRQA